MGFLFTPWLLYAVQKLDVCKLRAIIVKDDVMRVIHQFSNLQTSNLHWLNSTNIVLLPKKDGAEEIGDFRSFSLIHAIAKIIAKMLSVRLAPFMNNLVSNAQSAFIKKRSIHDNFM